MKPITNAPILLWLYLRGLNFSQYEKPYNPDQMCPRCKESFSIEDKTGAMPCDQTHWYHRKCLAEEIVARGDSDTIQCGHCMVNHEDPKIEEEK